MELMRVYTIGETFLIPFSNGAKNRDVHDMEGWANFKTRFNPQFLFHIVSYASCCLNN
jgi:hypothetical protein